MRKTKGILKQSLVYLMTSMLFVGNGTLGVYAESVSENDLEVVKVVDNQITEDESVSADDLLQFDTDDFAEELMAEAQQGKLNLPENHPYWKLKDPVHIHDANNRINDLGKWSCIYFGSYPRSLVTDLNIQAKIDKELVAQNVPENLSGVAVVDGVKYLKIVKTKYSITGKRIQELLENRTDEILVAYYRFDPITWRVLERDEANNKLLIMANEIIDFMPYDSNSNLHWRDSILRNFLNCVPGSDGYDGGGIDYFIKNAFSDGQLEDVYETSGLNGNKDANGYESSTTDKIFALSYDDIYNTKYGFCPLEQASDSRLLSMNNYSCVVASSGSISDLKRKGFSKEYWRLRTKRYVVSNTQKASISVAGSELAGVVPALYLKLDSNLYSYAGEYTSGEPVVKGSSNTDQKPEAPSPSKQSIKVSKKTVTFKTSKLKKKKAIFKLGAKAKTKLTYKVTKYPKNGKKYISVSKTGTVTMKKGTKKGTYKVTITAIADAKYEKATKVITIKVK